jgi:hypothetical protein
LSGRIDFNIPRATPSDCDRRDVEEGLQTQGSEGTATKPNGIGWA